MNPSSSSLSAHSPKFASRLVTLDHLRSLPPPPALGKRHKPIGHAILVEALLAEIERRGYTTVRHQLALGAKGSALFGIMDMTPTVVDITQPSKGRGMSFGFRSSVNESLAIKGVAGQRVFVCDNLSMSGDMIAFQRKSTTGMDLKDVIATGFDKFLEHAQLLDLQIEALTLTGISDVEAKTMVFDIFESGILPIRLFEDVARFYFKPAEDMTDCTPRSQWGLMNSFTRAMKDLPPVRVFHATVALGRAFGLQDDHGDDLDDVIDGDVIDVNDDGD